MQPRTMVRSLTVLVPTYDKPAALAVTLTSLCSQTYRDFDVIISDRTEAGDPFLAGEVQTAIRVLMQQGHQVLLHRHLPKEGIAEHMQFLLDQAFSFYVLFLDDDLLLEPDLIGRLMQAMSEEHCGFVGSAPMSSRDDERPQQAIELWEGPVRPELASPETEVWERRHLHSTANLFPVGKRLNIKPGRQLKYHVAWIGGCVLYDAAKLRNAGGFRVRQDLPPSGWGDDVLVQVRLLERYGGCGIIPSGVYRLELPPTITEQDEKIMIAVPAGELIDKITILEIKAQRIVDPVRLAHIRDELNQLRAVRDRQVSKTQELGALVTELQNVNQTLWEIEDEIREYESRKDFGAGFIKLARTVYQQNDRRAAIKRSINEVTGSRLFEEKSYADYKAA